MKISIYAFLICLFIVSCKDSEVKLDTQSDQKHYSLTDSIDQIKRNTITHKSIYHNSARVGMIRQELTRNSNNSNLVFLLAKELLNQGSTQEALQTLSRLFQNVPKLKEITKQTLLFHQFEAICYLRLAEQSNCQNNHTDESCIIPVTGDGIHQDRSGSNLAIKKYTEILKAIPDDHQSRWLLNVAHMTLGSYPQDVPKKWLIDIDQKDREKLFKNVGTFTGTDHYGLSGSVIADDFNNDGFIDLIVSSWNTEGSISYYQNNGDKGFENVTAKSGLDKIQGGLNIKQADYNNDGHLDFLILRGAWRPEYSWGIWPNSLMKNNGDGTFSDATIEANIYSTKPTQAAEWFDYNNDGHIDLFIANETVDQTKEKYPCELYQNHGDGTFKEVAKQLNIQALGYYKGCNSGDINNDGLMDIYLSNLEGDNKLFLNQGKVGNGWSFKDVSDQAKVKKPFASFPCWIMDIDNDGLEDITSFAYDEQVFVDLAGEYAKSLISPGSVKLETSKIYKNKGSLQFDDVSESQFNFLANGTMGSNYGDIDNDGFNDYYLGTGTPDYRSVVPNRFYTNEAGQGFQDRSFEYGLGHIQKGHGISFADFDNDGDLDIYAVMGGAFEGDKFHNALFSNPGNKNDWIKLKLIGTTSNKSAIGAKIKVVTLDEHGTENTTYHRISSGSSFGANPLMAHIGIPTASTVKDVSVRWPNGSKSFTSYGQLEKNTRYQIEESLQAVKLETISFEWQESTASPHQHHHH